MKTDSHDTQLWQQIKGTEKPIIQHKQASDPEKLVCVHRPENEQSVIQILIWGR